MGGKKIDRKKQALLSRSAKRKATIKKLTHKPVIKLVDVDVMKESFNKKGTRHHKAKGENKAETAVETETPVSKGKEKKESKADTE